MSVPEIESVGKKLQFLLLFLLVLGVFITGALSLTFVTHKLDKWKNLTESALVDEELNHLSYIATVKSMQRHSLLLNVISK